MKHHLLTLALTLIPTSALAAVPTCPTEFQPLITRLLKDLPSYTNRVAVRSHPLDQTRNLPKIITAGRPEFEPLPDDNTTEDPTLKQVFFTTLEQQIIGKTTLTHQQFHRLLLTDTRYGWRIVNLYTRLNSGDTPQPPRETSQGDLGQSIALWLRDCPNPSPQGKTPVR
jgi:hypothetical protein